MMKGKSINKNIPTLLYDNKNYETNEEKANLFAKIYKETFSDSADPKFEDDFKVKVENELKNMQFQNQDFKNKNLLSMNDLNEEIKK